MKTRYQVLVYMLFSFSIIFSQNTNLDTDLNFEHVYINTLLSNVSISTIHQDKTGFIWIGTADRLDLYDGKKFTSFYNNPNDTNSISNNRITKILEDRNGNLWIGTIEGLNRYNPKEGNFTRFLNNPKDSNSVHNNIIIGMVEDKYGNLWILTDSSISLYDRKTQKFKNYIINNKESVLYSLKPTSIAIDLDGNILVGYENLILDYIYITEDPSNIDFDIKHKRFFLHESNDKQDYISRIYQNSDKKYWIGTNGVGFFSIDYEELQKALQSNINKIKLNHYNSHFNNNNPFPKIITDICEDKNKNIYLTSFGDGLYRYNPNNNSFRTFKYDHKIKTSLNTNYLYSIYISKSDNIWIGTYNRGINKHSTNKTNFTIYHAEKYNSILQNNIVSAIYEDKEAILWIGSQEGISRVDRKTGKSQEFSYNKKRFPLHRIRSIIEDNQQRLWIGSHNGLFCFDKRSNKFIDDYNPELYKSIVKNHFLDNNYVRSLLLQNNILWIASYNGLVKYNLLTNKFIVYQNNKNDSTTINHDQVWSLYLDKFDNLWVGTRKGLNLFDQKTESFTRFSTNENQDKLITNDIIISIKSDINNILWVITLEKGLFCLTPNMKNNEDPDYSESKLKQITLPLSYESTAGGMVIDSKQNIWISSDDRIIYLDKNRKLTRVFDISEFMDYNQFTSGSYFRNQFDEIFFGGSNGMLSFFPEGLKYNDHIPHVVITSITINDSLLCSETVAANRNEIVLNRANDESRLTISFAALEFTHPENNYYKYMLDGYDKDWIDSKDINIATYMNLNPGTYTFKVMGSNNNKVWSDTNANLKIIVKPSFLESDSGITIVFITLLLFVYSVVEINSKRIKKQKEKLEIEVQNRTAQLQDANKMLEQEITERKKIEDNLNKTNKMLEQEIAERKKIEDNLSKNNEMLEQEIIERKQIERIIIKTNEMLEQEITERKQIEQKIGHTNELLLESNEIRDKLFSVVSHDLKGSIGSLKMIVKLLKEESNGMNEAQLELLESMDGATESTYNILETLLLWATNKKEEIENNITKNDLSLLLQSVGNNLQYMAKPKNIKLNYDIEDGYFAKFDTNSIELVIRNLTTNALKFTNPNGNVWYTVEKENSYFIISVNDDGVGISKENIEKIFKSKKRVTTLGTSGERGTGIGLILCKDFVKKNGGELWIESEPGKGSSFKFSLPVATDI